ncbi:hypothetical protein NQ318_004146 [Aromia moschata]|uniref:SSD domain-containing protein n=1 Tax=Aromia moschata TaxID=1265417 RepID=A0AAV8YNU6_9CUCU|nr:hypothetical protein NQ318_004146 [Aromia moschata]
MFLHQCHLNEKGLPENCIQDIGVEPEPLDKTNLTRYELARDQLREECSFYFNEGEEDPIPLCCDIDQIFAMTEGFKNIIPFTRCPTCAANLKSVYCQFSCSPNQSEFVTDYTRENPWFQEGYINNHPSYASSVTVNIYASYAEKIFNSCKDVSLPSTGGSVLASACGDYGATWCTPERWFKYMNDPDENPFTPFLVTYTQVNDSVSGALNFKIFDCNESWPNSSACTCVDCPSSCSAFHYNTLDDEFLLSGCISVLSLLIAGGLITLAFLTAIVVVVIRFRRPRSPVTPDSKRNGDKVHEALEDIFRSIGKTMAEERIKVLIMCLLVIICLSSGVVLMQLTTDPIQIWAAPNSQSRLEKDYFDQNFGPFYRTNQIFIKTVGIESFNFSSAYGNVTFGPGFNKTFLLAVFELQKKIENITIQSTDEHGRLISKGLESICYAPMRTVFSGERTINECTVMSLLGLFNNDIETFNKTAMYEDNLEKLISCPQSPYSTNCLAPYGGPVMPGLALGGASKDNNYLDAVGVTLTFLAENKLDTDELADTLAWEAEFIKFLEKWDDEERPEFMDIAYSAERSIQDGIDDLSESEASTVVISYVVMFVYIAIALGRFTNAREILFESKILLAVGGIIIVMSSVSCSLGVCGYAGISTTLLTIEVIPFLVLAVGVDNIFIIVQAHQRKERNKSVTLADDVGDTLGRVGPSMMLTSCSEICCFAIATLSSMPAVHTFAVYATVAVLFNFFLQITAFVALLSLDQERYESNRLDMLFCVKIEKT